jgi:hypothetical protein
MLGNSIITGHHGRRESQPLYVHSELGRGVEEEMSLAAGKKLGPYELQLPFEGGGITIRKHFLGQLRRITGKVTF